jgi:hypothetical protein
MKYLKLLVVLCLINTTANAQNQKQDSIRKVEEKDNLYSSEENTYIQKWLEEEVVEMGLSKEVEVEYFRILKKHTKSMILFGDSNKDLKKEEFKKGLYELVDQMNLELKPLLTENQFEQHIRNFETILWNISLRKGWQN